MDKRWLLPIGLALAVGVAIGVVAATAPDSRTVVGTPTLAAVASPPVVGDCLLGGPDGPFPIDEDTGEGLVSPYSRWFAACDGVRYGEVTAVVEGQARNVDADGYPMGRLQADCDSALAEYLGAPDPVRMSSDWWPSYTDGSFAVGPDPRQARSDQDWAACLIRPPFWGPDGREGQVGSDGYTTVGADSVRGQWSEQETRDRLGTCWYSDGISGDLPTYCGDVHDGESLAFTAGDAYGSVAEWTAGCRKIAAAVIGRDDPTLGGAISLAAYALDGDGNYGPITESVSPTASDRVDCEARPVDPGQELTASLVALGDDTPPLAPR